MAIIRIMSRASATQSGQLVTFIRPWTTKRSSVRCVRVSALVHRPPPRVPGFCCASAVRSRTRRRFVGLGVVASGRGDVGADLDRVAGGVYTVTPAAVAPVIVFPFG